MRFILFSYLLITFMVVSGQIPVYDFREFNKSLNIPENINSERSAVIVQVPDGVNGFKTVGDWQKIAAQAHKGFVTMGVDVILYMNHYDLMACDNSQIINSELFTQRNVKNLIFITQGTEEFEILILPFNGNKGFVSNNINAFYLKDQDLYSILLKTGKEIRRADQEMNNFLIPDKPSFLSGISIVEKSQLKNYPGILRRSTLAVEKFATLSPPKDASSELIKKIEDFNEDIKKKNEEYELIMREYPYDYTFIDPMSDEDLLRNRHQFVLRIISGQTKTLREMLDYNVDPSETDFVSVIPIMPDQTKAKPIPKNAIVHKFYIKQNVSKNVHVGEWDADVLWQDALRNMIGNLIQEHNVSN